MSEETYEEALEKVKDECAKDGANWLDEDTERFDQEWQERQVQKKIKRLEELDAKRGEWARVIEEAMPYLRANCDQRTLLKMEALAGEIRGDINE